MTFKEYHNADYWTKHNLHKKTEDEIKQEAEEQTLVKFLGLLLAGCVFFGLLYVACSVDATML